MATVVLKGPYAMPSTNVNALRDTTCSKENVPHVSFGPWTASCHRTHSECYHTLRHQISLSDDLVIA